MRVLFVGASQIKRIRDEVVRIGKNVVSDCALVKVRGELSEGEVLRVVGLVRALGGGFDKVYVGGPGSSLIAHGFGQGRGTTLRGW